MSEKYLEKENNWFKKNISDLIKENKGKWAVVFEEKLIGIYPDFSTAYEEGVKVSKSEKILVKQIINGDETEQPSINLTLGLFNA